VRLEVLHEAMAAAAAVGFRRVHFTGGEPLLYPQLVDAIALARRYVNCVGLTSNGILLAEHIGELIQAGLNRVHISVHHWPTREAGRNDLMTWLQRSLINTDVAQCKFRLNVPIPAHSLPHVQSLLQTLAECPCEIQMFMIFPSRGTGRMQPVPSRSDIDAFGELERAVSDMGLTHVSFKRFHDAKGIRCTACADRAYCRESSHALRLGPDHTLRPCLASRQWDIPLLPGHFVSCIEDAALLALDF
jgi:cyclic pyranopterin phosphate synthase